MFVFLIILYIPSRLNKIACTNKVDSHSIWLCVRIKAAYINIVPSAGISCSPVRQFVCLKKCIWSGSYCVFPVFFEWTSKVSTCSKTQHSDFTGVESQTSNPSIRSLRTLYQLCVVVMVVLVCVCVWGGGGVFISGEVRCFWGQLFSDCNLVRICMVLFSSLHLALFSCVDQRLGICSAPNAPTQALKMKFWLLTAILSMHGMVGHF